MSDQTGSPGPHEFRGTNRFAVLGQLGAGSMCVVFRVRDQQHGDVVALKTLRHLDSNSLYRLKQEFRALSHFDHPNLVSFYELVYSDQGWFVTMELVEGVDFLSHVRGVADAGRIMQGRSDDTWASQPDLRFARSVPAGGAASADNRVSRSFEPRPVSPLPDLIRLRSSLRQLAEGVQALHVAGRVHRDLKPSNVLVTESGRVVILDFGLVAEIDQDYTEGTLHQNIAGSAAYMSPEQSVGKPLTAASDWYGVGVMLYEALTGAWPYSGHLYQILTAKQEHDPIPVKELQPAAPDDLAELCMALLARDPELRPSVADIMARLRYRKPALVEYKPTAQPRFRFRDEHVKELLDAFQTAKWGRTVASLVRGGPGMGKTTLVREFIKNLNRREEVFTLKGRSYEWESVPFKALDGVIDNLSRVLRRLDHRDVATMTTENTPYLGSIFPVLSRVDPLGIDQGYVEDEASDEAGSRGFAALRELLKALAQRAPVIIHIDDVQFGDTRSAEFLTELVKAEPNLRLLIVLSYRAAEHGGFMRWFLSGLQDTDCPLVAIDLEPLTVEHCSVIAGEMLGADPESESVRSLALESGGVPMVLRDLVRQAVTLEDREIEQSTPLNEVVVAQIEALPRGSRLLLELLAVCGQAVATDLAIHMAQLGPRAFAAISTLRAHELVRVTGGSHGDTLEIASDALRDYVYDSIGDLERRDHHLVVANALEFAGVEDAAAVIRHYAGAGAHAKAGLVAWLSAQQALAEAHYDEAVWMLNRALEQGEWSPRERRLLLTKLGDALAVIGKGHDSAAAYRRAVEEAPMTTGGPGLLHRAAEQLITSGHVDEGLELLEEMLVDAGLGKVPSARCAGPLERWRRVRIGWTGLNFKARQQAAVDHEELLQVDLCWTAANGLGLIDVARGAAFQALHVIISLGVGEEERAVRALANDLPYLAGRDPSGTKWREAQAGVSRLAEPIESPESQARLVGARGRAAFWSGRWAEALQLCSRADRILRTKCPGVAWERFVVRFAALRAHLFRGDMRAAAELAYPMLREAKESENQLFITNLTARVLPELRMAEDDPGLGVDELTECKETWSRKGFHVQHAYAVLGLVRLDLYRERAPAAWTRLTKEWSGIVRSGVFADPVLHMFALLTRGACAAAVTASDKGGPLKEAQAAVRAVNRANWDWAMPWAQLLRASIESVRGRSPLEHLKAAEKEFEFGDMWLGAAVARRQRALLEEGEDAAADLESAVTWMQKQGIRNVERMSRAIAPGF